MMSWNIIGIAICKNNFNIIYIFYWLRKCPISFCPCFQFWFIVRKLNFLRYHSSIFFMYFQSKNIWFSIDIICSSQTSCKMNSLQFSFTICTTQLIFKPVRLFAIIFCTVVRICPPFWMPVCRSITINNFINASIRTFSIISTTGSSRLTTIVLNTSPFFFSL